MTGMSMPTEPDEIATPRGVSRSVADEARAPWWADEAAQLLLAEISRRLRISSIAVLWKVRVDQPHPRRFEEAGEFITMGDGRVALAARQIWAGWTPGYQLRVTLDDGTVVTSPWTQRLTCCEMHNHHCEPPADLCCEYCTERNHPNHNRMIPCVLGAAGESS